MNLCGDARYEAVFDITGFPFDSTWLMFDSLTRVIRVRTSDRSKVGVYALKVIGMLKASKRSSSTSF